METTLLLCVLTAIVFSSVDLFSQTTGIVSLKIQPVNPPTNDEVQVIAIICSGSGGCDLRSFKMSKYWNKIIIDATHNKGMLQYICYSTDTINLGKFPVGSFELIFNLYFYQLNYFSDSKTIGFDVKPFTGISSVVNPKDYNIYPNPAGNIFNIKFLYDSEIKYSLEIYNLSGQKVKTINDYNNNTGIDCSDLRNGVYFIEFSKGDKKYRDKIIINSF
jgi:hypothetical protein